MLDPNVSKYLSNDEVREILGYEPIVKEEAATGGIKGVITNPDGTTTTIEQGQANESISNLSRRQTTNLLKVVQDYNNGRTTKEQAMILLKGYGLNKIFL